MIDVDEFSEMVLDTIRKMRQDDGILHPSNLDIVEQEQHYRKSLTSKQKKLYEQGIGEMPQHHDQRKPNLSPAELLAARHKMSFVPGSFAGQGLTNGFDRPGAGSVGVAGQHKSMTWIEQQEDHSAEQLSTALKEERNRRRKELGLKDDFEVR